MGRRSLPRSNADRTGCSSQAAIRRLQKREFRSADRNTVLVLCRRLCEAARQSRGREFAAAVADATSGAARQGLSPHVAFRVAGLVLDVLGLSLPVGVGSSVKQVIFEGLPTES